MFNDPNCSVVTNTKITLGCGYSHIRIHLNFFLQLIRNYQSPDISFFFNLAGRVFCKKGCDADGETWEECEYHTILLSISIIIKICFWIEFVQPGFWNFIFIICSILDVVSCKAYHLFPHIAESKFLMHLPPRSSLKSLGFYRRTWTILKFVFIFLWFTYLHTQKSRVMPLCFARRHDHYEMLFVEQCTAMVRASIAFFLANSFLPPEKK